MKKQYVIVTLKESWLESTWSDIQTTCFVVAPFAVNSLWLGNNGYLNFVLMIMALIWFFSVIGGKHKGLNKMTTSNVDEAILFLDEHRKRI